MPHKPNNDTPANKLVAERITHRAQPQTQQYTPPQDDMAWLVSPEGKRTYMRRVHAQWAAAKWKGYKVV